MVNKSPESRPGFAELLPVGQGVQDAAGDIRPDDDFGVVRGGSKLKPVLTSTIFVLRCSAVV